MLPMTFKKAVEETPHLKGKWQAGLGALRAQDRPHIQPASPKKLRGSVDVDDALKKVKEHAQANRWDFGIGFQHTNRNAEVIYWVEIHTGSDSEISVVLRKLAWLNQWLSADGKTFSSFESSFVWVPSGATSFTKRARQVKELAMKGLRYAGSGFKISDSHPRAKS
jgi:hypothetical protein